MHTRAKEEAIRIEALRESVAKAKADAVEAAAAEEAQIGQSYFSLGRQATHCTHVRYLLHGRLLL